MHVSHTACQADVQDVETKVKAKWEETVEVFREYVNRLSLATDDITEQITSSQMGKEME